MNEFTVVGLVVASQAKPSHLY